MRASSRDEMNTMKDNHNKIIKNLKRKNEVLFGLHVHTYTRLFLYAYIYTNVCMRVFVHIVTHLNTCRRKGRMARTAGRGHKKERGINHSHMYTCM